MTRLMMALANGDNLFASTTFHKGKGSAPAPTPMIAPAPPVEEASVELSDREKIKAQTKKSELRMPVANALNTGIKMAQLKKKANGNV